MSVTFTEPEELLSDESFLAWYFKTGGKGDTWWDEWMAGHPERTHLVQQAIALLEATRRPEKAIPAGQVQRAEAALLRRLDAIDESGNGDILSSVALRKETEAALPDEGEVVAGSGMSEAAPAVRKLPLYRDRRWMIAAAILVVLSAGLLFTALHRGGSERQWRTAYGEMRSQQLPDGSVVLLNANTQLRCKDNWKDGADREVWVTGEAFFQVSKTPMRSRFIVHTEHLQIVVTGTRFNVVNRNGTENVLLKEGSVILRCCDGKEMDMKPGDFITFRETQPEKRNVQPDSLMAWQEHKLVFAKTPLRDVVSIINIQYGVHARLANEGMGDSTISGMVPNNNLEVLLKSLKLTSDFDIIRNGDQITIDAH